MKWTDSEIIAQMLAKHSPMARNMSMVYQVWEDGEVTITKGAELFGFRTLHVQAIGNPSLAVDCTQLPHQTICHGSVFCKTYEDAMLLHEMILSDR